MAGKNSKQQIEISHRDHRGHHEKKTIHRLTVSCTLPNVKDGKNKGKIQRKEIQRDTKGAKKFRIFI